VKEGTYPDPHADGIATVAFTLDHYDAVHALWSRCEGMGLGRADSREGIARYLERNPGMSRVALDGGRVIGALLAGHDGRRGNLNHLAVDPAYRHRGIGRRMLAEALERLREAGIDRCHGQVFSDNTRALEFWQTLGWTIHGEITLISKPLRNPSGAVGLDAPLSPETDTMPAG